MKQIKIIGLIIITLFLISCGGNKMNQTALFETNQGTFEIELFEDKMPITTKNFIKLAEQGFYKNTKFHRVIPKFMIQGGDPLSADDSKKTSWGTGGPGYTIKDEFHSELSNLKGTIAMANAGPNTGGSQFFINLVTNDYLDSKHPVFGKVVDGMEIIEKIGQTQTNPFDQPLQEVVIKKITIK